MAELLIIFRETLEAVLIVGILLTYLNKTQKQEFVPRIWQGVLAALVAEDLEQKAESTIQQSTGVGWGIFTLAFIAVFREGVETVLFLYGVMINQGSLSLVSSLIGAGFALGIGYLIFIQGQKVPLKTFFNVSSVLLIFVAAGMVAYGFHELESAGIFPDTGRIWDVNPPKLPDGSYPAFHDKGTIGAIAKGLFGWNGDPSFAEVCAWFTALLGLTSISPANAK